MVIGSGVGGLTSALLLQRAGWEVTVLERHTRAGGFLHRFFREGVGYDTGFHYVGSARPDQPVGRMLRLLGVYDELRFRELDPDGFDRLRFPDLEVAVPASLDRWMERLGALFPAERAGLAAYAARHRAAVAAYAWYTLDPTTPLEAVLEAEAESVTSVLESTVGDPRLRAILGSQAALYGVPNWDAPFGMHALVTDHFMSGAWTIEGGGDRLALALVRRLRAGGGHLRLGTPADAIETTGGKVSAVQAGGERHDAEVVVSNVHPQVLLPLLPAGAVRPAYRQRVADLRPGRAHLGVYLRVRGDLSAYARSNLYRYATWDPRAAAEPATPSSVPFWFLTSPGAREQRALPGARDVVLGLVQADWNALPPESGAYAAYKQGLLDATIEAIRGDHPDWEILRAEASTPRTTWRYTGSPLGATYGHYHSLDQMGRYRLAPYARVPGLWQVGQTVGMPGICGAMTSAFVACDAALGGSDLLGELRALG